MTDPKNYFWRVEVVGDTSELGISSVDLYQVTAPDREQALIGIANMPGGDRRVVGGPFCMVCLKPVAFDFVDFSLQENVAETLENLLSQCPDCQV